MGLLLLLLLLLTLSTLSHSQNITTPPFPGDHHNLRQAIAEMSLRSFDGFVILLKMLDQDVNHVLPLRNEFTFLVPTDKALAASAIPSHHLQRFLLTHLVPTGLGFDHLLALPSGTQIPSGLPDQMLTISNHGRLNFSINNARVVAPNICKHIIRCHGINEIINFSNQSLDPPPVLPPTPSNSLTPSTPSVTLPQPIQAPPRKALPPTPANSPAPAPVGR